MSRSLKPVIKVLVMGDVSVGKTSLIRRYVHNRFTSNYYATIGVDVCSKEITFHSRKVTLQIWDTAGQERFQSLSSLYYRGTDCCVLVYNVTDPESLSNLEMWREEFLIKVSPEDPNKFPFVVLGNKADIQELNTTTKSAFQWCSKNNIPFFETSAKDDINVEEAFELITKLAMEEMEMKVGDLNGSIRLEDPQQRRKCFCR